MVISARCKKCMFKECNLRDCEVMSCVNFKPKKQKVNDGSQLGMGYRGE